MSTYTLKNIKIIQELSEETLCFTASLYRDGSGVVSRMPSTNHGGWRIGAEEAAGGALQVVPSLLKSGPPGSRKDDDSFAISASTVRRLTPTECERLMGWPDDWTAPEGLKAPDSRRYAACGDGVVANVAEWIGLGIIEQESLT